MAVSANVISGKYRKFAASQTIINLAGSAAKGAIGEFLDGLIVIPTTVAAGAITIKDGTETAITVWVGGAVTALTTLVPFYVPLGLQSRAGGWQITTGTNVEAIFSGDWVE